mmetsp:Transcript_70440/g.229024  ORF Transcript_70440/g.229024 Transcript_70440/m.229024 type:complete len:241 (-) Transcript_70440:687-1409(-)
MLMHPLRLLIRCLRTNSIFEHLQQLGGSHAAVCEHDLAGSLCPHRLIGLQACLIIVPAAHHRLIQCGDVQEGLAGALGAERQQGMGSISQQCDAVHGPRRCRVTVEEGVARDSTIRRVLDELGEVHGGVREAAFGEFPAIDNVQELVLGDMSGPRLLAGLALEVGREDGVLAVDTPIQQRLALLTPPLTDGVQHRSRGACAVCEHAFAIVELRVDLEATSVDAPTRVLGPLAWEQLGTDL